MAFSQDKEDASRPRNLRSKASFPSFEKKRTGSNLMGKLLGKQSKIKNKDEDSMSQEMGDIDRIAYLGHLKPSRVVRPNDPAHKGSHMQPRREEGLPPRGPLSEADSDSFVSPITRARNRAGCKGSPGKRTHAAPGPADRRGAAPHAASIREKRPRRTRRRFPPPRRGCSTWHTNRE